MIEGFKVSGLDLSLTSTGVAVLQPGGRIDVHTVLPGKRLGHHRLRHMREQIRFLTQGSHRITVESAAFGRPNKQWQMGGFWWLVMHGIWINEPGIEVVAVPPSSLKQYVLGKGSGAGTDKIAMALAVQKRYPEITVKNGDEADAVGLLAMTLDWMGTPLAAVPQKNHDALNLWPYTLIEDL